MKKILITIDEETLQRIEDLKEMELETMGLKWSTSEVIRSAIYKKWRFETIQGIEDGETKKLLNQCTNEALARD